MNMWILQASEDAEAAGPDDTPVTFRMTSGAVKTIGRAAGADFILDRALVSRLHCRLTAEDERIDVEDLSSTNGTFVNGKRVRQAQIASGDRLRVGRIELTVEKEI